MVEASRDPSLMWLSLPSGRRIGLFLTTLSLGASTACLATILGSFGALWLESSNPSQIRKVVANLYLIPLAIPSVIYAQSILSVLAMEGPAGGLLLLGIRGRGLASFLLSLFTLVLIWTPLVALFVRNSLSNLDANVIRSGLLERDNWQVYRTLVYPILRRPIQTSAVLVFVFTAVDYTVPSVNQLQTYIMEIYADFGIPQPGSSMGTGLSAYSGHVRSGGRDFPPDRFPGPAAAEPRGSGLAVLASVTPCPRSQRRCDLASRALPPFDRPGWGRRAWSPARGFPFLSH